MKKFLFRFYEFNDTTHVKYVAIHNLYTLHYVSSTD